MSALADMLRLRLNVADGERSLLLTHLAQNADRREGSSISARPALNIK